MTPEESKPSGLLSSLTEGLKQKVEGYKGDAKTLKALAALKKSIDDDKEIIKKLKDDQYEFDFERAIGNLCRTAGLSGAQCENGKPWLKVEILKKLAEYSPSYKIKLDEYLKERGELSEFVPKAAAEGAKKLDEDPDKAAETAKKIDEYLGNLPGGKSIWKTAIAGIFTWWKLDPEKGFGKMLAKLFGLDKKDEKTQAAPAPAAAQAPAQAPPAAPETAPKLEGKEKEVADLFKQTWGLDENSVKTDLPNVKGSYEVKGTDGKVDEEKTMAKVMEAIRTAASDKESNLNKISEAVKKSLPGKTYDFRLEDILFQNIKKEDAGKVAAVIENKDSKFTPLDTDEKIRAFLLAAISAKDTAALDEAIKKYEKPAETQPEAT